MATQVLIKYKGQVIGEQTALGKTLDKKALYSLRPVDRLRAYLLMVYPQARTNRCLSRVCGIPSNNIPPFLKNDIRAGAVHYLPQVGYMAFPQEIVPPPLTIIPGGA